MHYILSRFASFSKGNPGSYSSAIARVVRWAIFILNELGIQYQTQHLRHVWFWIFTCYLNIWIMSLECAKGRQVAVVGRSWGNWTRVYLGDKKSRNGRQRKLMKLGPRWWKNMVTRNGEKCNMSHSLWLLVIFFTVLVLSLDLERHSKIL